MDFPAIGNTPFLTTYWGLRNLESKPRGLVKRRWKKYQIEYRLDVYKTEFGIQIDHVHFNANLGYIYAYENIIRRRDLIRRTSYILPSEGSKFYDDSIEDSLGGSVQKLGG